jgi:aminoglycoside phosphotransferase family enzyme
MTETGWITQRETHIAVVMLIGDRAYKLKKPVSGLQHPGKAAGGLPS